MTEAAWYQTKTGDAPLSGQPDPSTSQLPTSTMNIPPTSDPSRRPRSHGRDFLRSPSVAQNAAARPSSAAFKRRNRPDSRLDLTSNISADPTATPAEHCSAPPEPCSTPRRQYRRMGRSHIRSPRSIHDTPRSGRGSVSDSETKTSAVVVRSPSLKQQTEIAARHSTSSLKSGNRRVSALLVGSDVQTTADPMTRTPRQLDSARTPRPTTISPPTTDKDDVIIKTPTAGESVPPTPRPAPSNKISQGHVLQVDAKMVQVLTPTASNIGNDAAVRIYQRHIRESSDRCNRLLDVLLYLLCFFWPATYLVVMDACFKWAKNSNQEVWYAFGASWAYNWLVWLMFTEPIRVVYRRVVTDNVRLEQRLSSPYSCVRVFHQCHHKIWKHKWFWNVVCCLLGGLQSLIEIISIYGQSTRSNDVDAFRAFDKTVLPITRWFSSSYAVIWCLFAVWIHRQISAHQSLIYHPYVQPQFPSPSSIVKTQPNTRLGGTVMTLDPVSHLQQNNQSILMIPSSPARQTQFKPILVAHRMTRSLFVVGASVLVMLLWILQPWFSLWIALPVHSTAIWITFGTLVTLLMILWQSTTTIRFKTTGPNTPHSERLKQMTPTFDLHLGLVFSFLSLPLISWLAGWFALTYQQQQIQPASSWTAIIRYIAFLVLCQLSYIALAAILEKMTAPHLYTRFLFPQQVWTYLGQVLTFGFTPVSWQLFIMFLLNLLHQVLLISRFYHAAFACLVRYARQWCCCWMTPNSPAVVSLTIQVNQDHQRAFTGMLDVLVETQLYLQDKIAALQAYFGVAWLVLWFRMSSSSIYSETENQTGDQSDNPVHRGSFTDGFLAGDELWLVMGIQLLFQCITWGCVWYILKQRMQLALDVFASNIRPPASDVPPTPSQLSSTSSVSAPTRSPQSIVIFCTVDLRNELDRYLRERYHLDMDPIRYSLVKQAFEQEYPQVFPRLACDTDAVQKRIMHWHRWFPTILRKYWLYFLVAASLVYAGVFNAHVSCPPRLIAFPLYQRVTDLNPLCGFQIWFR